MLEREVRTNLLYRTFMRIGGGKVPDAKATTRAAGDRGRPHDGFHFHIRADACEAAGDRDRRPGRHDSPRPEPQCDAAAHGDRAIARSNGAQRQEKLTRAYQQLFATTSRVLGQVTRFAQEIRTGVRRTTGAIQHAALEELRQQLETFVPQVQQVLR